jgi:sugar lactone lactonase YvrE
MEIQKVAQGGCSLSGAAIDRNGVLHVSDSQTGSIYAINQGRLTELFNTHGQPVDLAFDPISDAMHICDLAHQSVLRVEGYDPETGQPFLSEAVREYEERALRGPTALIFDITGAAYFTDSGPLGETTLGRPLGSVYVMNKEPGVVRALACCCLAHPRGLCLAPEEGTLYVAEMMQNRILRLSQKPKGVFHMSVFHTFSGLLGPSACACDDMGRLFVGRYDFRDNSSSGLVSVILPTGALECEIVVPGPEVTGLAYHSSTKTLYITESSTNTVYAVVV